MCRLLGGFVNDGLPGRKARKQHGPIRNPVDAGIGAFWLEEMLASSLRRLRRLILVLRSRIRRLQSAAGSRRQYQKAEDRPRARPPDVLYRTFMPRFRPLRAPTLLCARLNPSTWPSSRSEMPNKASKYTRRRHEFFQALSCRRSLGRSSQGLAEAGAADELTVTGLANELVVLNHDLSSDEHHLRGTQHFRALE